MKTTPNIDVWLNQVQARSLRTVFDHLPGVMFFAKDLEGRFTMANLAFAQRCGCKDEASLLGKTDSDVFPPLAGSEWIAKGASIAVRNILHGMQGPVTVKGQTYNSMMPPVAGLTDRDIADVVTYVNNSFGNTGAVVTEAEVKAIKAKYADRKTPWTAAEYEKEGK